MTRPEDEFKVRIILGEETFQVTFELGFESMDRLEKRDWRSESERCVRAGAKTDDGIKSEDEKTGTAEQAEKSGVIKDVAERVQIRIVAAVKSASTRMKRIGRMLADF